MKLLDGRDLRLVNENNEEISEENADLTLGYIRSDFIPHEDGTWEDVMRYILIPQDELDKMKKAKETPNQGARLKAVEDALMQMMLGGNSNV